jgi:hypothetical protein
MGFADGRIGIRRVLALTFEVELKDFVQSGLYFGGHLAATSGGAIELDRLLQGIHHCPAVRTTSQVVLDLGAECLFEVTVYVIRQLT